LPFRHQPIDRSNLIFGSAKLSPKQSTSCIVKKQVDPLIWTALSHGWAR
jgi:hypothetical protein